MSDYACRLQAAYINAKAFGFENLAAAFAELLRRELGR